MSCPGTVWNCLGLVCELSWNCLGVVLELSQELSGNSLGLSEFPDLFGSCHYLSGTVWDCLGVVWDWEMSGSFLELSGTV